MANEYQIRTIVDMARIPEEAVARFCAELPIMLNTARGLIAMMEELHAASMSPPVTDEAIMQAIAGARWVDDDKGNVDISVNAADEDGNRTGELFSIHHNYKTGACNVTVPGEVA